MVEQLLLALRQKPGLEGGLSARILDDGDAVGAWEGKALAAVLFPTPETLKEVGLPSLPVTLQFILLRGELGWADPISE